MQNNNSWLNLKYNIIQAPMAVSIVDANFVAKVCNAEMLGSIPAGYLSLENLTKFIKAVKHLTNKQFLVNLFIEDLRDTETNYKKTNLIMAIEKELGMEENNNFTVPKTIPESVYIDLIIKEQVPIVSTTFGFLSEASVKRLKANNIKIIGTATNYNEFLYLLHNGSDAVVLQGVEAGGHTGSFLANTKNELSTLQLLKEVRAKYKDIILIAAGGVSINNIESFWESGANYVQLGTAFMMTNESLLPERIKQHILEQGANNTVITEKITGKYSRGVNNKLIEQLNNGSTNEIYNFPIQHYHTSKLRGAAKQAFKPEYMSLWAGSNQDNLQIQPLAVLLNNLQNKYQSIINKEN